MDLHVHVHHTFDCEPPAVDRRLDDLLTHVIALRAQGEQILMAANEMQASLDRINAATNNIAGDLAVLKGQISTGMSQADVDAVQARLDTTVAQLEALAAETPDEPTPA